MGLIFIITDLFVLTKQKSTVLDGLVGLSLVFYSKTFCPYCTRVKKLLTQLGASYKVVELDAESKSSFLKNLLHFWDANRWWKLASVPELPRLLLISSIDVVCSVFLV